MSQAILGDIYNSYLDVEEIDVADMAEGDVVFNRGGKLVRPKRLPSGLYQFRQGTGHERCVFDCIGAINAGADLLWIETAVPTVHEIKGMMDDVRKVHPDAKLGLQQLSIFQLDSKLPSANLRCNG